MRSLGPGLRTEREVRTGVAAYIAKKVRGGVEVDTLGDRAEVNRCLVNSVLEE